MINSSEELVYGDFFINATVDQIYTSKKFTAVKKIIRRANIIYILCNGNIYFNTTLSNDNFIKIPTGNHDLKFIDIVTAEHSSGAVGLSTDYKLYTFFQNNIHPLVNKYFNAHPNKIVKIYGCMPFSFIIKMNNCEHYHNYGVTDYKVNNSNNTFLGFCDSIYYHSHGFLAIYDGKILHTQKFFGEQLKSLDTDTIDIVTLKMIPSGSFIHFYDNNNNKILYSDAILGHHKILYSYDFYDTINICCSTGNVCDDYGDIIPELKDCSFDRLCDTNRYAYTKNARSCVN